MFRLPFLLKIQKQRFCTLLLRVNTHKIVLYLSLPNKRDVCENKMCVISLFTE